MQTLARDGPAGYAWLCFHREMTDTTNHTQPRLHYAFVVLAIIVLVVLSALGLGRFGYSIVLPTMQDSLGLTNVQAGELQTWNLAGYLIAAVSAGVLAVRFGPRLVISISAVIVAVSLALTGLAPDASLARWARALTGLGAGGVNVPAMGLVPSWFGAKRRGTAAGIAVAGSSLGLMITGPLVPHIISIKGPDQGWRTCWYVFGAMALAIALLATILLRNRPSEMGLRPVGQDPPAPEGASHPASSLGWSLVVKSPALWHLAAVYFCFGLSYTIYYTFLARYLVKECGFTQAGAGTVWFQVGVGSAVSGLIWGTASDRWGRRAALVAVFLIQAVSFSTFGLFKSPPGIYCSAFLFSITAWSIPAIMAAVCGDRFGARAAPAALGLVTVVFGIGQAIGPLLAGAIADATQSCSLAFVLSGLVALGGAGGSLALRAQSAR
jgi:predicted MFS family arabinose efflux permease